MSGQTSLHVSASDVDFAQKCCAFAKTAADSPLFRSIWRGRSLNRTALPGKQRQTFLRFTRSVTESRTKMLRFSACRGRTFLRFSAFGAEVRSKVLRFCENSGGANVRFNALHFCASRGRHCLRRNITRLSERPRRMLQNAGRSAAVFAETQHI